MNAISTVGAIVLAAGQSTRMGQPKMILPWGDTTVIGKVVDELIAAGITEIVVVTGGAHEQVQAVLQGKPIKIVHNPLYAATEMVVSLQVGLRNIDPCCDALLVVLGDQPLIDAGVVRSVVGRFRQGNCSLVIPSYQMHRGHPWLIARELWGDLQNLSSSQTLRDFLNARNEKIVYVNVNSPGILSDMDTPEDYAKMRPVNPPDDPRSG